MLCVFGCGFVVVEFCDVYQWLIGQFVCEVVFGVWVGFDIGGDVFGCGYFMQLIGCVDIQWVVGVEVGDDWVCFVQCFVEVVWQWSVVKGCGGVKIFG